MKKVVLLLTITLGLTAQAKNQSNFQNNYQEQFAVQCINSDSSTWTFHVMKTPENQTVMHVEYDLEEAMCESSSRWGTVCEPTGERNHLFMAYMNYSSCEYSSDPEKGLSLKCAASSPETYNQAFELVPTVDPESYSSHDLAIVGVDTKYNNTNFFKAVGGVLKEVPNPAQQDRQNRDDRQLPEKKAVYFNDFDTCKLVK